MPIETLPITGHRGLHVPNALNRMHEQSRHLAILLPGFGYRTTMPALYYSRALMLARGADVLTVDYTYDLMPDFLAASDDEKLAWIRSDATAVFDAIESLGRYERLTIIGKSAGTAAMAMVVPGRSELADAELIWLTPGFRTPGVPEGMARCAQRSIIVIGSADPHYNEEHLDAARRRGAEVLVVPDLDHGLEKPNDVVGSVSAMTGIMQRLSSWIG
ncbi:hypothetical protein GGR34_002121 [Microvirga flocculans]|uniref:Alpha/beta hydrolase n=1 Tax=Microvirga flocculans TaxID=217168 RepID=A0A7W6N7U7_9HYPH|nr:alpha/beta hydrolase [Microvirga flocculans]MBB4040468.1 hypothetical protein [Microvirga flocculans]